MKKNVGGRQTLHPEVTSEHYRIVEKNRDFRVVSLDRKYVEKFFL